MELTRLRPILWTHHLEETILFYVNVLGFSCIHSDDRFASLTRDEVTIMVIIPEDIDDWTPALTGSIFIDSDDVDGFWARVKDKVKVVYPPRNQEWPMRDFEFKDNNGYTIVIGQEITEEDLKNS